MAYSDIAQYYNPDGSMKPMSEWTKAMSSAVQSMDPVDVDVTPGETGPAKRIMRLKLWDKPKNVELLFKHLQLLEKRFQISGDVTFGWKDSA